MGRRFFKIALPLFGLAVFSLALWALYHELHSYRPSDIAHALRSLPPSRLMLSLALTALSYLAITGYDVLGARYVGRRLPYRRTALAAFTGTSVSNNLGFGILTGGSVRLRLYGSWGLSALEVSKLVVFDTLSLWIGFLGLGAVVFCLRPPAVAGAVHLPVSSLRPAGLAFAAVLALLFAASAFVRRPLRIAGQELPLPSPRSLALQLAVAAADWLLAGAALYALLPPQAGLSFAAFLGIYLLSLLAGVASQVPGGLGVFETVFVLLTSSRLPASAVVGTLLAYRGIYYLLPLAASFLLLLAHEAARRREQLRQATDAVGRFSSLLGPPVLAALTALAGIVLLASGATAAVPARMAWLERVLPLPVVETSHFLGSVAGILLIILARGVQRRLDAAYLLICVLLGAGIVFSLLKGADYEEAAILGAMLAVFLPARPYFRRKASLLRPSAGAGWIAAAAFAIVGTVWLTLFSYKHVEYSSELWWRFAFDAHAPRSLRALTGAAVVATVAALTALLRPHRGRIAAGTPDWEQVRTVVRQSPDSSASLALLGDKQLLFSASARAFLMYAQAGGSCVSMGDPVGPEQEWPELVWRFRELAERHGCRTVFYEVGAGDLGPYLDLGLSLHKLGEEARVDLQGFSLQGSSRRKLRYAFASLEREGGSFEVIAPAELPALLPEIRRISDAWLREKHTREKGFSLGRFDEPYLRNFPLAVVRLRGRIVAFGNLWAGENREECSIDLMRHLPDAPRNTMEYLFTSLLVWGKAQGYRWFNLGMVPLAGLADHALAPLWDRIGTLVFRHGESFYNFEGLRRFKEKFAPVWRPRYLASPGGFALAGALSSVATLVSGGVVGLVSR